MSANGTGYEKLFEFVDCSNRICQDDPIRFMKIMLQDNFCLHRLDVPCLMGLLQDAFLFSLKIYLRKNSINGIFQRRSMKNFLCRYLKKTLCLRG
uniref:Uncharacterized protein n=1 Tax=Solanum lycopersicum TaxID=4081 RepID=A0A3Q7FZ61_SOLLC